MSKDETLWKRSRRYSDSRLGERPNPKKDSTRIEVQGQHHNRLIKEGKLDPSLYPQDEAEPWNIKIINTKKFSCLSVSEVKQPQKGANPSHGRQGARPVSTVDGFFDGRRDAADGE